MDILLKKLLRLQIGEETYVIEDMVDYGFLYKYGKEQAVGL